MTAAQSERAMAILEGLLTDGYGIVDERFLTQVPNSPLKDSQRLVIRRADAEAALGDLAALVRGLAAS